MITLGNLYNTNQDSARTLSLANCLSNKTLRQFRYGPRVFKIISKKIREF